MIEADVPSAIDLRTMRDASQWADEVSAKRPCRPAFFEAFACELRGLSISDASILELGSGPGFLAQYLLDRVGLQSYTAMDFSDAMHSLAKQRLGPKANAVTFLARDFLDPAWDEGLPLYSSVITLQAVHELRHKRRAPGLYSQVLPHVRSDGIFLMCDHYYGVGGMANSALFMSEVEHVEALTRAGFVGVTCVHKEGGMVLYRAKPA